MQKEKYNKDTLSAYLNNRNYAGAAQYLRNIDTTNYNREQLDKLERDIFSLDQQASDQHIMMSSMDDATKQAYHFIQGLNGNGTIPHADYNPYIENYNVKGNEEGYNILKNIGYNIFNTVSPAGAIVTYKSTTSSEDPIYNTSKDVYGTYKELTSQMRLDPIQNIYGDDYISNINKLQAKQPQMVYGFIKYKDNNGNIVAGDYNQITADYLEGRSIQGFNLRFANEEAYNAFIENVNESGIKSSENISKTINNDGSINFEISKNDTQLVYFLKAANKVKLSEEYKTETIYPLIAGEHGNISTMPYETEVTTRPYENDYTLEAYITVPNTTGKGETKYYLNSSQYNYQNIQNAVHAVDDAESKLEQYERSHSLGDTFVEETYITPFLSAGEADAYKALREGKINTVTYNRIRDIYKEKYNNLIRQADLIQYQDVYYIDEYASSNEDDVTHELIKADQPTKAILNQAIRVAMNENRLTYNLATSGGLIGTYITISSKPDKGTMTDVEFNRPYTVFIPNLVVGDAHKLMENDTKFLAVKRNGDLKRFDSRTQLSNGDILRYENKQAYIGKRNTDGEYNYTPIDEATALNMLDTNYIIRNSAEEIKRLVKWDDSLNEEELIQTISKRIADTSYSKYAETKAELLEYEDEVYRTIKKLLYVNL